MFSGEGSSQSRLPVALESWRRYQSLLETVELNRPISIVFYPQVEFQGATVSHVPGSCHREHELTRN